MQFARNSNLTTIKEGFEGNLFEKSIYCNFPYPNSETGTSGNMLTMLKAQFWNPHSKRKKYDELNWKWPTVTVEDIFKSTPQEDCIAWLGHACCYVRLNGVSFITDPVLVDLFILKRKAKISIEDIRNIDYVLISHGHRDHLDITSISIILKNNPDCRVLMPLGLGKYIDHLKSPEQIQEAGWWQKFDLTNFPAFSRVGKNQHPEVILLPAIHWHMRTLMDQGKALWGSFLIEANRGGSEDKKTKIYFAGDTRWGPYFPEELMKNGHIDPEEAVKASVILDAKYFIPIHHSTYQLGAEGLSMPIEWVRRLETEGKLESTKKREFVIGKKVTFEDLEAKSLWEKVYQIEEVKK
eukprot:GHVP01049348.1.p1 GENE.GHVP01049348.1~~GHVP01049348.1.p1  ORF type:complete len:352 (-),score=57.10 GHVP01049348.1:154-1209(-)